MANLFTQTSPELFLQLLLAVVLGGLVGIERELKGKEAGMRTYALVALGSALFTIVGIEILKALGTSPGVSFDPSRVIYAVAIGIGFIGAGAILHRESHVEGITTAAGLWVVAAIGVAVGFQLYIIAVFVALLALLIFSPFRFFEKKLMKTKEE